MATLETLQTRLAEAEQALHELNMGERVVEVWRDGRRVTYQSSDKGTLQSYVDSLTSQIAEKKAEAEGRTSRRRPIGLAWTN